MPEQTGNMTEAGENEREVRVSLLEEQLYQTPSLIVGPLDHQSTFEMSDTVVHFNECT